MNFPENNKKVFLLTGSTGSFGRFILLELLKQKDLHIILLIRAASDQEALERVKSIVDGHLERVRVFAADLTQQNFALPDDVLKSLSEDITHIVHSAASTRFNLPLEAARIHNVEITQNMLEFALGCPNLIRFGFLSTTFVAGKRFGLVKEDEFEHTAGFSNSYQETKYEAEMLVRKYQDKLPLVIFRPPLIISPPLGLNKEGERSTNILSILVSFIASGKVTLVPSTEDSPMDLVNAIDVARVIIQFMLKERLQYLTYQLTNGYEAITLKNLQTMIENKIGKKIPMEYCGDLETFHLRLQEKMNQNPELSSFFEKGKSFLLEPAYGKIFDNAHTLSELQMNHLGELPIDTLGVMFKNHLWTSSE